MKIDKHTLLAYFKDFFTFHNPANKDYSGIDDLFESWYNARIDVINEKPNNKCPSRESIDGKHHIVPCSSDPTEGFCCEFCGKIIISSHSE